MLSDQQQLQELKTLNRIAGRLNQAVDVRSVLEQSLADLVHLMDLETGWIALREHPEQKGMGSDQFVLAAHHNLPPAMASESLPAWQGTCTCQSLASAGKLCEAYNEVRCSRLGRIRGRDHGLSVHASVPLLSGDRLLGILNVAAPDWSNFGSKSLSLLTTVGSQIGTALERARLYDLLQERRLQEQTALLGISDRLLGRTALNELMDYLVERVRQVLLFDACALLLPAPESGTLEVRASSGWRLERGTNGGDAQHGGSSRIMRTGKSLLVEDLQIEGPLAVESLAARAAGFRGHAAVPLLVEQRPVGVLVANQREARLLNKDELASLELIANQAALAIEEARLLQEEVRLRVLQKELELGRQIQVSLLPHALPSPPGWEFAAHYQPAHEVGGDFYDLFSLADHPEIQGMVIGDVTGKGIPAALYMARASSLIRSAALPAKGPSAALVRANELLLMNRSPELFLTAAYVTLDVETGHVVYASAGHCRPILRRAGAVEPVELNAPGMLLGAFDSIHLEERDLNLAAGDLLVLYSDGVTEALGPDDEPFGVPRLMRVLAGTVGLDARGTVESVIDSVRAFSVEPSLSDDLTLLVVRRLPDSR